MCLSLTVQTSGLNIWLTISHPGMDESDTIGDMVRMKLIQRSLVSMGNDVSIITTRTGRPGVALAAQPRANRPSAWKSRLKGVVPRSLWVTLKDQAYRRNNQQFSAILESRPDRPELLIDYNFYWNDAALRFGERHHVPVILNIETLVADSMPEVRQSWLRDRGEKYELAKYRRAARLWAVSEPLADAVAGRARVDRNAIDVVPNAAQIPGVTEVIPAIPADAIVLGFVGGFADWYSLDKLVAKFLSLRQTFPRLFLLLIGDGPERSRIEDLLQAAPRASYLLTGKVPHAAVPSYIARMDVCAITNHTWWSSPLKLLEYGALGKAVVAPDLPSITSMITSSEACLFRTGDFAAFEAACRTLLGDGPARHRLGVALREAVMSRFSLEAMTARIRASIGRLPAGPKRPEPVRKVC